MSQANTPSDVVGRTINTAPSTAVRAATIARGHRGRGERRRSRDDKSGQSIRFGVDFGHPLRDALVEADPDCFNQNNEE